MEIRKLTNKKILIEIGRPIITIAIALLIGAAIIALMGEDPVLAYSMLFKGAFKGLGNIIAT